MRINLILGLLFALLALAAWSFLSGGSLVLAIGILLVFSAFSAIYHDKMILFFLGAREISLPEQPGLYRVASQEAYKLALSTPSLFYYNGTIERGFVLQKGQSISLVLNKSLLDQCSTEELSALCFELLLQVKLGLVPRRTRLMFLLGMLSWMSHSGSGILRKIFPIQEVHLCFNWLANYLLNPWIRIIFDFSLGKNYFKKIDAGFEAYPLEKESFLKLGLKLRRPELVYSLPSRKLLELSSLKRSQTFQNIISLEFLPHEWDYFFQKNEG